MLLKAGADPRIVDPCSFNSLQICARIGCLRYVAADECRTFCAVN